MTKVQKEAGLDAAAVAPHFFACGMLRSGLRAGTHTVRRVQTDGVVVRVAGTGTAGSTGNGLAATSAQLNSPTGASPDGVGGLYIVSDAVSV